MNRDSYNAIAQQWDSTRTSLSQSELRIFSDIAKRMPQGSRVLDLGCGTGRPVAQYFAGLGFSVTGVDQSARMLDLARKLLPHQTWLLSSLECFEPTGIYAAAIAWDSLFHIERAHHIRIWRRLRGALSVGAPFALTVGGMEHPAFTDKMFDQTFFYDSHAPEKAMSLLEEAGYRIVYHEFLNQPTDGRDKGRVAIVACAA